MLAFIILLVIGFISSSVMYTVFAKNAIAEPIAHEAETVVIGRKSISKAA